MARTPDKATAAPPLASNIGTRRHERRNNPRRRDGGSSEQWEAILDAAATVFHRMGYASANVDDIATEVALNRSSIYYYVSGKADLLDELGRRSISESLPSLRRIAEKEEAPVDKIRALIEQHMLQFQDAYPRLFVFLNEKHHHTAPDVKALADEVGELRMSLLTDAISAGVASAAFRPDVAPRLTARLIIGMCADVRFWWTPDGPRSLVEIGQEITTLVISGMEG